MLYHTKSKMYALFVMSGVQALHMDRLRRVFCGGRSRSHSDIEDRPTRNVAGDSSVGYSSAASGVTRNLTSLELTSAPELASTPEPAPMQTPEQLAAEATMLQVIEEAFTPCQGNSHPYRVIERALREYALVPEPEQVGVFSDRVFEELCRRYKTDVRISQQFTLFQFHKQYPLELFWQFVKFGGRVDSEYRLRLLKNALRMIERYDGRILPMVAQLIQESKDRTQRLIKFEDEKTRGTDHHVDVNFNKSIPHVKKLKRNPDPYTDFMGSKANEFLSIGKLTSWGYNEQDLDGYLLQECMNTGFPLIKAIYIPGPTPAHPVEYLYRDTDAAPLDMLQVLIGYCTIVPPTPRNNAVRRPQGQKRVVFQMSRAPRQDAYSLANTNSVMRSEFLRRSAVESRVLVGSVNTNFASFFEFDGVQNNNITNIILPDGDFAQSSDAVRKLKLLQKCLTEKKSVIKYIFTHDNLEGTTQYLYNSKDTRPDHPPVLNLLEVLQSALGMPLVFVMEPQPLPLRPDAVVPEHINALRLVAGNFYAEAARENVLQLPRPDELVQL